MGWYYSLPQPSYPLFMHRWTQKYQTGRIFSVDYTVYLLTHCHTYVVYLFWIMDDVKVVTARLRITANGDLRRHTQRAWLTSLYHNRGASERNVAFSESHQCQSLVPAPPPASQAAPMLRKLHSKPTCIYGVSSSAVGKQTTHYHWKYQTESDFCNNQCK